MCFEKDSASESSYVTARESADKGMYARTRRKSLLFLQIVFKNNAIYHQFGVCKVFTVVKLGFSCKRNDTHITIFANFKGKQGFLYQFFKNGTCIRAMGGLTYEPWSEFGRKGEFPTIGSYKNCALLKNLMFSERIQYRHSINS